MKTETKFEHFYLAYGNVCSGYGSSMDPHVCGDDENEPCITLTYEREVSDWTVANIKRVGETPF